MKLQMEHGRDYFSPSQLKKLYISVGQFKAYLSRTFTTTRQMNLGSAIHCAVLEPELFDSRYIVFDDAVIREEIGGARPTSTKAYKEWLDDYTKKNEGKDFLTQDEKVVLDTIVGNLKASGVMDRWFVDGQAEETITGVVKKYDTRFDALCIVDYDSIDYSVDLKTTSKPLHKFKWDANDLGYDIQASLTNAINGKPFVFVVVQTVAPYDIGVYTCSKEFMQRGADKINHALDNYDRFEDFEPQVLHFEL